MELHLIRHGQTDWNEERRVQGQSESRLTDLGITQAKAIGEKLKSHRFDKLYSSSSQRTRETADHAFAHFGQPVTYLDSLREIYLGPWEGKLYAEVEAEYPDSYRHFWSEPHLFDVEGAETFYEMQKRALATIREIGAESQGQRVAIISHGALIKSVLAAIEGLAMEEMWKPPVMHNCAHNIIKMDGQGNFSISLYADQPMEVVRPRS